MQNYVQRSNIYSTRKPAQTFSEKPKSNMKLIITLIIVLALLYAGIFWIFPSFVGGLALLNKFKGTSGSTQSATLNPTLAPPVFNIPYEATNTATISIPGYTVSNAKVELFKDGSLVDTIKADSDGKFHFDNVQLTVGTNNIYGKTVDDKGLESLASQNITINYSNEKPPLEVDSPQDGQTFTNQKITVSGQTDSNVSQSVTINDSGVILNSNGGFSKDINLNPGQNTIVIKAADSAGNVSQVTRTVTYNPTTPSPSPTSTPTPTPGS